MWLVGAECVGAIVACYLMLNPVVAADHAVVPVVYSIRGRRPVAIIVAGRIAAVTVSIVVTIIVEAISIVVVAVPVDDGLVDVGVVVVANVATTAAAPIHSPGAEAPTPTP